MLKYFNTLKVGLQHLILHPRGFSGLLDGIQPLSLSDSQGVPYALPVVPALPVRHAGAMQEGACQRKMKRAFPACLKTPLSGV